MDPFANAQYGHGPMRLYHRRKSSEPVIGQDGGGSAEGSLEGFDALREHFQIGAVSTIRFVQTSIMLFTSAQSA